MPLFEKVFDQRRHESAIGEISEINRIGASMVSYVLTLSRCARPVGARRGCTIRSNKRRVLVATSYLTEYLLRACSRVKTISPGRPHL